MLLVRLKIYWRSSPHTFLSLDFPVLQWRKADAAVAAVASLRQTLPCVCLQSHSSLSLSLSISNSLFVLLSFHLPCLSVTYHLSVFLISPWARSRPFLFCSLSQCCVMTAWGVSSPRKLSAMVIIFTLMFYCSHPINSMMSKHLVGFPNQCCTCTEMTNPRSGN